MLLQITKDNNYTVTLPESEETFQINTLGYTTIINAVYGNAHDNIVITNEEVCYNAEEFLTILSKYTVQDYLNNKDNVGKFKTFAVDYKYRHLVPDKYLIVKSHVNEQPYLVPKSDMENSDLTEQVMEEQDLAICILRNINCKECTLSFGCINSTLCHNCVGCDNCKQCTECQMCDNCKQCGLLFDRENETIKYGYIEQP